VTPLSNYASAVCVSRVAAFPTTCIVDLVALCAPTVTARDDAQKIDRRSCETEVITKISTALIDVPLFSNQQ